MPKIQHMDAHEEAKDSEIWPCHEEVDNPNLIFHGVDIVRVWDSYNQEVLSRRIPNAEFELNEFKLGSISEQLAISLLKSLDSLPKRMYERNDCSELYLASRVSSKEVYTHNRFFSSFNFKEEQLALVKLICEELKPVIESCLGIGFRVINVKAQESYNKPSFRMGPNKLHMDGFPKKIYKALVYLTEASKETGHTILSLSQDNKYKVKRNNKHEDDVYVIGPPGTFLFFNPNTIWHRGVPGEEGRKIILEITICPAYETEINPTFNGTNSRHPIRP